MTKKLVLFSILFAFLGFWTGRSYFVPSMMHYGMDMDGMMDHFLSEKDDMQMGMREEGNYRCCLIDPCTYCLVESKDEDEVGCDCLENVMTGKHPCGECMGEILEGHGNKFLSKYFAKALSDELGSKYETSLKRIISEKYGISIEDQI